MASTVISRPDVHNEGGLPLTEIREELDEVGNVICMYAMQKLYEFLPNFLRSELNKYAW